MALVDHRAVQRHRGLAHTAPVEGAVDDDGAPVVVAGADEAARVRLEQERAAVEGVARRLRSVDADRVAGARAQERRRDLPHPAADRAERLGVGDPVEVGVVEDDELDGIGRARPHAQRAAVGEQHDAQLVELAG